MTPAPIRLALKPGREVPFLAGHPWVFSGALADPGDSLPPGSPVQITTRNGAFVAHGLCNPNSQIRVRLYSWDPARPVDDRLLTDRIRSAVAFRASLPGLSAPDAGVRLVYSESDGLSGLTVDRYASHLSVQFGSLALAQRMDALLDALEKECSPRGIYLRTEKGIRELEGLEADDRLLRGRSPEGPVLIRENGLLFETDPAQGHKTGFYLDQRDNRGRAAAFAAGRKCLDLCCYTGGFALNLARGGASEVLGIDASAAAIETARRNAGLNSLGGVVFEKGDAFKALETFKAEGRRFGIIVLDPPRFAQSQKGLGQAVKGYVGLNELALRVLEPGGILVTCSCSGRVTRDLFREALSAATRRSERTVRILEERGAALDHPVSPACPETDYLKCFLCHVD